MTCHQIQPELCGYHFGVIADDARRAVEDHLVSCSACVKAFVALKRDIETAGSGPSPSPAARERLRRAVAAELGVGGRAARRWSWWERPLAFGFAGAALAAALVLLSALHTGAGSMPRSLEDRPAHSDPIRR
jgi:anti-sigma factor RsiW